MYLECTCVGITKERWDELMKNTKPMNYKWLVAKIKKHLPELYYSIGLDYPNPWASQCCKTKTHWILVHSAIEYFINKSELSF